MAQIQRLLLSVGAMKSGTTWLYRQLEQHPSITFSPEKEIHYLAYLAGDRSHLNLAYRAGRFATARRRASEKGGSLSGEDLAWYLDYLLMPRTWDWYARRFRNVQPGNYCADFSNLSALLDGDSWQRLLERVGDLRLLYILRNPLDRVWSQLKSHFRASGRQQLLTDASHFVADPRMPESELVRHSLYAENLQRIVSVVPRESVHIVLYEQIEQDPEGLLRDVEDFLGIAPHSYLPAKLRRRINSSDDLPRPAWLKTHFAPYFVEDLQALARLGVGVPEAWYA